MPSLYNCLPSCATCAGRGTMPVMNTAEQAQELLERLFPICRSITGDGARQTLSIIKEYIPLEIVEVPTGTQALDWTVPKEWNIKDAYIVGPDGKKFAQFKENNLHVMSYSIPVHARMPLLDLKGHLHTFPDQPDIIPYKTSYYDEQWGFCLTHNELQSLPEGEYEVVIDSTIEDGSLTYGELHIPGETTEEILLSCYVCHPSMANDNLSGVVVLTLLAQELMQKPRRFSYRLLFIPETIGSIVWLSRNRDKLAGIRHGLVATCAGDGGPFTYKKSRQGDAEIDRVVASVLNESGVKHTIVDFFPMGSDERQYCSPGFDLPMGSLMRTMYYHFPEYHTSADNLQLVTGKHLGDTITMYCKVLEALESTRTYTRVDPFGEPQLGRRGLYDPIGGPKISDAGRQALMWVLNYSDGKHSLLDISLRAKLPLETVSEAAHVLESQGLLR